MSSFFAEDLEALRDQLEVDPSLLEEMLEQYEDEVNPDREQEANDPRPRSSEPIGLQAVRASEIQPEAVEWLWQDRIPVGAVTVLSGDPGLGKSLLTCDLSARLSRGKLTGQPAHSLLITAEDALAMTVRPRLEAAGADLELVHLVRATGDARFWLPDGIDILEGLVTFTDSKLVVIDPLTAHLASGVNSWQDQSIRTALAPLHTLAEEQGVAIVVVSHLNKGDSLDPQRRIGGSIGIPAAARSVLLLARDPEDPEGGHGNRRILAHVKSNLGQLARSQLYEVGPAQTATSTIPRLLLLGDSNHEGADLLVQQHRETRSALADAVEFLRAELSSGPRAVAEIQAAAGEVGIALQTLKRARQELSLVSIKSGYRAGWTWELPGATASTTDD